MKKTTVFLTGLATMLASVLAFTPAYASVSITSPVNASISSDSSIGSSVALPVLTLSESAAGDIPAGTLTWAMPTGFMLDMASIANVSFGGNGLAGSAVVSFPDSTHFSLDITATSVASSSLSIGTVTPLKVKASSGSPLSTPGNVVLSAGTLTGTATGTSFGVLTQVAGSPSKLAFTVQPPSTTTVGSAFSTTVGVQDQFGNLVSSDNGRGIVLSANLLASSTAGVLGGSLSQSDASGLATFSGLTFSAANQISLTASSVGLTNAVSSNIAVSAVTVPPTTTPPVVCNLRNGSLVKVKDSSTVYMVVNCVLRPFTTPAVFHAKGKKFANIVEIDGQLYAVLGKGKAIGKDDDDEDDDTVIIPGIGQATTTPPSISGLPEGSVVKLPGSPTVYMVVNGQLQPFTSGVVFSLRGKKFGDVKTISAEQFSSLSVGSPVTLPDGSLVRGSNQTIFVIEGGKKKGIISMDVFNKHGWSLKNVVKVSDDEIGTLEHGGNKED